MIYVSDNNYSIAIKGEFKRKLKYGDCIIKHWKKITQESNL